MEEFSINAKDNSNVLAFAMNKIIELSAKQNGTTIPEEGRKIFSELKDFINAKEHNIIEEKKNTPPGDILFSS